MNKNREILSEKLVPQQLSLAKDGGAKLVHSVRMPSEMRRDFIVVKLDTSNVNNGVSQASVIHAQEKDPALCWDFPGPPHWSGV